MHGLGRLETGLFELWDAFPKTRDSRREYETAAFCSTWRPGVPLMAGGRDRCGGCQHPRRSELDVALVSGASLRQVAREFDLTRSAVHRHKQAHLPQSLIALAPAAIIHSNGVVGSSDDVIVEARRLYEDCRRALDDALQGGSQLSLSLAAREVHRSLDLLGRQLERIELRRKPPPINIFTSKDWQVVVALIIETWGPYPEAKAALIKRLREVNAGAVDDLDGD
jgi:hypothetical protein